MQSSVTDFYEEEYYSNCCDAPPAYEVDEFNKKYSGICMNCKEGAVFRVEKCESK